MDTTLLASLAALLPADRISTAPTDRQTHSHDESFNPPHEPDVIVWPETAAEVSTLLRWATENHVPVTPWGGGSSLEGNPIPLHGGVALDMTRMSSVLEVLPEDFQVRVQPGIVGDVLNTQLARYGLFFPAFPGSANVATVGGMIANNSGGMYTIRYGVVGDNVMAVEAVLPTGEIVRVGSRSIKTVAGYDLLNLLIGSEGTLAVITEAVLRLRGIPRGKVTLLVAFAHIEEATAALLDLLGSELQLAALELMDSRYVGFVNQAKKLGWEETPSLLIELHGLPESIAVEVPVVVSTCQQNGGRVAVTATTQEDQTRLWDGRRAVRASVRTLLPGSGVMAGDVGIPISAIPEFITRVRIEGETHNIPTMAYGHAGDGNFHVWAIYTEGDQDSWRRAVQVNEALTGYAIDLGGTSTAEHGIAIGKRKFLKREHASSLPVMKAIKHLFDPAGILNPGKIFEE